MRVKDETNSKAANEQAYRSAVTKNETAIAGTFALDGLQPFSDATPEKQVDWH